MSPSNPDHRTPPDRDKRFFYIGLILIAILYSFYSLYLQEPRYFQTTSRILRHIVRFGLVIIVYGIGYIAFRKACPSWLIQVWHSLYALIGSLLILIGLGDQFPGLLPLPLHNIAITLHEFLISPIPYTISWVISRYQQTA